ncbi:MAG: DUF445 domain-containing protein [Phascolarctobacterium sp.]|nr:DUF445 domain-containing protein [Phascolarctobacterium sp.]
MTISKKNLALGSLVTAGIGTAATYPFAEGNVFISLLHHGFMAATVGGLADWFGITALFHEPLGISYHTNVLINNRKRIEHDLAAFICNDLLSVENILETTKDIPLAQLIINHLQSEPGKKALGLAAKPLIASFLAKTDLQSFKNLAAGKIPEAIASLKLPTHLLDVSEQIIRKDYLNPSIDMMLITLKDFASHDEELKGIVANLLDKASQKYTGDILLRQIFAKISVEEITKQCLTAAKNYLQELRNPEHELRIKLKNMLLEKIGELRSNENFAVFINNYATSMVLAKLAPLEQMLMTKDAEPMYAYLEAKLENVNESEAVKSKLDAFLRDLFKKALMKKHDAITKLVTEKLSSYSDEELVQTIEGRVGDDLQMIRLNGTIVGGFAGMLLYLITLIAERMWS